MFNFFSTFGVLGNQRTFGPGSYDNIQHAGATKINGATVSGSTAIAGSAECVDSHLNTLKGSGSVTLENTTVRGETTVAGRLQANNSRLNGDAIIASDITHLTGSEARNLVIKNPQTNIEQEVVLDNSRVRGNIHFENGNGRVVTRNGARVDGTITGATVIDTPRPNL